MTQNNEVSRGAQRIFWLDNLRTFMIFLVVVLHSGLVYESSGISAFFWIVDDPSTNHFSGILNLMLDIFVMPVIFFISGYLALPSLRRRTAGEFLKDKFRRLIIPWALAALTLLPIYKMIFLYSRGLPQEPWPTYFHWSNGIWGQNWLWFLPVLFLFDLLWLLLSRFDFRYWRGSFATATAAGFLLGLISTLALDLLGASGWTKTPLIDFQNERLLLYLIVFAIGSLCYQLEIFDSKPKRRDLLVVSGVLWLPLSLYLALVIHSLVRPGEAATSPFLDLILIRLSHLVSLLGLGFVLVTAFRLYLNKRGSLLSEFSRNSYSVYIIHVIVMGGIALVLLDSSMGSLLKHLILAGATFLASNLLVSLFRRLYSRIRPENRRQAAALSPAGTCTARAPR